MSKKILLLALCFSLLLLTGCLGKKTISGPGGGQSAYSGSSSPSGAASGASIGEGQRGTTPYTVLGKTYYPLLSVNSYSEEGIASWYGPDFHGKQTASGEIYDMHALTAAHKLLPFGTMVKVTSLDTGKSVIVRINDRGPFVDNRIIDLSRSGAAGLDMLGSGTARVRLETVGNVAGLVQGELQGLFYVQVGAFNKESNAQGLVSSLAARSAKTRIYYASSVNMWRVQIGPHSTLSAAEHAADSLRSEYPHCFIVAE